MKFLSVQEPTAKPCCEYNESSPHLPTQFKIHFNIIFRPIFIPLKCSLLFRSPRQEYCTDICMPFMNATFSTLPIMISVVKSTNYESHFYPVCLLSCHSLSCLSVLPYTTHVTSLICRHVSQFMYFLSKTVYTCCEALTVVSLGIQAFQNVTQHCLDLLFDKNLHCGKSA